MFLIYIIIIYEIIKHKKSYQILKNLIVNKNWIRNRTFILWYIISCMYKYEDPTH